MLSVLQADDQLMHLQWKDRGTGTVEVSLCVYKNINKNINIKNININVPKNTRFLNEKSRL